MVADGLVLLFLEVMDAEGIGGEQAVIAGVPVGGVAGGFRAGDDGDNGGLAEFVGAGVGGPLRALAPCGGVGFAVGVG